MQINNFIILFDNQSLVVTKEKTLFFQSNQFSNLIIDSKARKIGDSCFKNDTYFNSVIISDYIEDIESNAFAGCKNLKCLVLGKAVSHIGQCAFSDCPNLKLVFFNGTMDEYKKILRGEPFQCPIHCLDGDIPYFLESNIL